MNLIEYIVKVKYHDKHVGSAVIIKTNNLSNSFYIFTAKHIFFNKEMKISDMKVNDIVTNQINIENPCLTFKDDIELEVVDINKEYDFLIIKVSNCKIEKELPTNISMDEMNTNTKLYIMGFPYIRDDKKTKYDSYPCTYKHICENEKHFEIDSERILTVRDREGNANHEISGLSGSGVYLTNDKKSIVGILIESATGQGIVCFDLRKIIGEINKKLDTHIPIVESQEKKYSDIKQILKEQYNDVDEFKQAILEYYPSDSDNFDKIKKINTIDELFLVLLDEKWCLYCLFEALKKTHNLEEFSDTDCSKKREQALKTRIVETIILKFKENKSRDDYTIQGWLKYDSGSYRNMSVLNNIKFDNNDYEMQLSEYLAIELKEKIHYTPLQLELILPIELFIVEFKTLKIKLDRYRTEKKFNEVFNMSTRFLTNIENYYNPYLNIDWKKNSKCYRDNLEEMIENRFLFHIEDTSRKEMLDCYNNNNKISILSNYSLLDCNALEKMIDYGLPFILCPQNEDEEYNIVNTISFNNILVRGMKQKIFSFIREKRNESSLHYIHDNYYDYDRKFLNIFLKNLEYQETDDDNYLE